MRDHVMGIRAVNGLGEVFRSGGRVLKNVTGLDLCKLLAGSHGTLGVITEITLKVLPAPPSTGSVAVRVADLAAGVRVLSAGLGSPFGVSGAALLPGEAPLAILRLEDFSESVAYRGARLCDALAGMGEVSLLADAESRALWRSVRDAEPLGDKRGTKRSRGFPSSRPPAPVWSPPPAWRRRCWTGRRAGLAGPPATAEAHARVIAAATAAGGSFTVPRPNRCARRSRCYRRSQRRSPPSAGG